MNDLSLKLKNELIKKLTQNEQNLDDEYFVSGNKRYTRRDLAKEIEDETEFGIKTLTNILMLAIDLTSRQTL